MTGHKESQCSTSSQSTHTESSQSTHTHTHTHTHTNTHTHNNTHLHTHTHTHTHSWGSIISLLCPPPTGEDSLKRGPRSPVCSSSDRAGKHCTRPGYAQAR